MSETMAAATRKRAAPGTETRAVSLLVRSAPDSAAAPIRIAAPKDVTSSTIADPKRRTTKRGRSDSKTPYFSVIHGILRQEILSSSMQRLCLSVLVAALALPAAAIAANRGAKDGTLVVRNADAKIMIWKANGTVFGRLAQGKLIIDDNNPVDE